MVNRFNPGKRLVRRHGLRNRLALLNLPMVHCLPLYFAKGPFSFSLGTIVMKLLRKGGKQSASWEDVKVVNVSS